MSQKCVNFFCGCVLVKGFPHACKCIKATLVMFARLEPPILFRVFEGGFLFFVPSLEFFSGNSSYRNRSDCISKFVVFLLSTSIIFFIESSQLYC